MTTRRLGVLAALSLSTACASKNIESKPASTDENSGEDGTDGSDAPPPELRFTMDSPSNGTFRSNNKVEASGTWSGGLDGSASVNGEDVGGEGDWSMDTSHQDTLWPDSPLWPVMGSAQDSTGQWVRARATLIHGESTDTTAPMPAGLVLRLTDELLLDLGPQIDDIVAGLDLDALLVSAGPVWADFGAEIYVSGASIGTVAADLDFQSSGLHYVLTADDLVVFIDIDLGLLGSYPTEVNVQTVEVAGDLVFGTSAGSLTATPANTAVSTVGLEVFGFEDTFGLIDGFLGDTLATTIEDQLVGAIDGLLDAQDALRVLEFSGMQILSDFTSATHDNAGVNVYAESTLAADGLDLGQRLTTDGGFTAPSGTESPSGVPYQAALLLDDDLLSAIGAALPATGLLDQSIEGDALGSLSLDTSLLGGIIPGFDQLPAGQPVSLHTRPTAPMVGAPGSGEIAAELHLGGLEIDFLTDQDGDGSDDVVMTVVIDAIVGITGGEEGALVDIVLIDSQSMLLSTSLDTTPEAVEPGLDTLISLAVPALVGGLVGDALAFDLGGIGITVVDGSAVGDRAGLFLDLDISGLEL